MRGLRCVPLEEGDSRLCRAAAEEPHRHWGMLSQAECALRSVRADGADLQMRLKLPFWKGRDSTHLLAWFKGYTWCHLSSWNLSYRSTNCSHKNICPRPLIKHIIWEYFTWLWPFGSVVLDTTMNKTQKRRKTFLLLPLRSPPLCSPLFNLASKLYSGVEGWNLWERQGLN